MHHLLSLRVWATAAVMAAALPGAGAMAQDEAAVEAGVEPSVEPSVTVTEQAFCLQKRALDCDYFASDGDIVRLADLPRDDKGNAIVYFYSVQRVLDSPTFLHFWETVDDAERARAKYFISDSVRMFFNDALAVIQNTIESVAAFGDKFGVVMRPAVKQAEAYRAYSLRIVYGPGEMKASVINLSGKPIPASEKITLNIID